MRVLCAVRCVLCTHVCASARKRERERADDADAARVLGRCRRTQHGARSPTALSHTNNHTTQKKEYAGGSAIFAAKIEQLSHSYGWMRRTRGDGNCFFRSFIFALLETLVAGNNEAACKR